MSDHFKIQGRALLANGYIVVPIRKGEKRPALSAWQKSRLGVADLARYPDHGVGIICGQGAHPIVGVDVDISHPVIGPAVIAWCQEHMGYGGERVGAAPRILLAYRAASSGWAKGASVQFFDPTDPLKPSGKENNQQVEILGLGQQFVAYHEHPDTGRDYEWVDILGGLEHLRADDLPVITETQVAALLAEVARLVRVTPGVEPVGSAESPMYQSGSEADDLMSLSAKVGTPIAEMAALMANLQNDGDSYDHWAHVGMSLHHEYAGTEHEDDALQLWHDYGAKSSKNQPGEYAYKWRSFGGHSGAPTTLRWLLKICHLAKREGEFESRRDALNKAKELIKAQTDSLRLHGADVVKQLKELIPDDPLVVTEIIGAFQAQYKLLTKTTMPITQAKALLLGTRAPTVQAKRPLTEFGNAERMLDRYGDGMMFVPEMGRWYLWTGVYWRRAVDVEIEHLAKETIRALVTERDDHEDAAEFFQFCAISQQAKMVGNMVRLAASDPRVAVPARELDAKSHLLGVRNGVVDLRSGTLLPPDPEHRITLVTACNYDPSAKCPLYTRTLGQVFYDDTEVMDYFMRALGYSLMGNPREEVLFIPFGNGANGKGTLLNTVREALGDYGRSAEASSFVSDGKAGGAGGAREDLVRLRGSRLVYVNEPDENGELREGAVKSMTGGDSITARGLYAKDSVEISPSWVVWMPTNHKPIVKGGDNGIWRRLVLLPFTRDFEKDPLIAKDGTLKDKLLLEKEGVLALVVKAAIRYQSAGLAPPSVVRTARDQYRSQMDLLSEWLEECCDLSDDALEVSNRLWLSWEQFAKNRGILHYVKSSIALNRKLDSRFPSHKSSKGTRMRRGLSLKGSFSEAATADTADESIF